MADRRDGVAATTESRADIVRAYLESLSEHRPSDAEEAVALTALEKLRGFEEALRTIAQVPSRRTLLMNAEVKAMYALALRALEGSWGDPYEEAMLGD